jgi:hypothetical protein
MLLLLLLLQTQQRRRTSSRTRPSAADTIKSTQQHGGVALGLLLLTQKPCLRVQKKRNDFSLGA